MSAAFRALMVRKNDAGVAAGVEMVEPQHLPDGDTLVRVAHSTLNYKDGLVICGQGGLVKTYPHIPGIDFSGTVMQTGRADLAPGDEVILTGWFVGERRWGGYAQFARVPGEYLVPITQEMREAGLSLKRAMAVGTAGLTSMLAVLALERMGVRPESGPVLVTGAAGGVGSVATAILAKLGYTVAASTGRPEQKGYLRDLGASEIVARADLEHPSGKPLETEIYAGCIDSVGAGTLATALTRMKRGGCVTACGLAGGPKLETTVIPFLLRGVSLVGIDSVQQPLEHRLAAWRRIATDLPFDKLDAMTASSDLEDLPELGRKILAGKIRGRRVVNVD